MQTRFTSIVKPEVNVESFELTIVSYSKLHLIWNIKEVAYDT